MNKIQKHIIGAVIAIIGAALLSTHASPALAQESPASSAGLPQLDLQTFPPQLIWLAITFIALYLLMSRIALPRIGQVIEERQHRIEDNLSKAETLRNDAAAAGEAYEAALAEARAEAHSVMVEAHDQIAGETAARLTDLGDKLDAEMKRAEANITEEKDKALSGMADIAVEVAKSMTERLSGGKISDKDVANAVEAALQARR